MLEKLSAFSKTRLAYNNLSLALLN